MSSWALPSLLLFLPLLLTSCVMLPIPLDEDKVLAGRPVSEEQLAFLQPGITTRQEVIDRFGQPNVIWEDTNIYSYHWDMRQGILLWAAGAYYTGGAGIKDIPKHYLLLIQFNNRNLVRRFERAVRPLSVSYSGFLQEWAAKPVAQEKSQDQE